jgi:hypothetical protein
MQSIVEQLHIMVLGSCEFCENWLSVKGILYFGGINGVLFTVLYIYCPIWIKFGVMDLHAVLLSISEFCENWRTGCSSVGINEIGGQAVRVLLWALMKLEDRLCLCGHS